MTSGSPPSPEASEQASSASPVLPLQTAALSFALCTCAMDADPRGVSSIDVKYSFQEHPRESFSTSSTSENDMGVTSDVSFISSSQYLFGRISECRDIICPSFIYVGPSSSRMMRSFSGETPLVILLRESTSRISFSLVLLS